MSNERNGQILFKFTFLRTPLQLQCEHLNNCTGNINCYLQVAVNKGERFCNESDNPDG